MILAYIVQRVQMMIKEEVLVIMEKHVAVRDPVVGNIKVTSNGQTNSFRNTKKGYEHFWYNSRTRMEGYHGDSATAEEKRFMADVSKR